MSESTPLGNRRLLDAMFRASKDRSAAAQEAVYRALLESPLLMPIPNEEQVGTEAWTAIPEPVTVKFISAPPAADGSWRFLAFSSEGALLKWRPQGCRYVAMLGPDVFRMLMETEAAGLDIDVAGPWGGELPRAIVQLLAEGTIPLEADEGMVRLERAAGTQVSIGAPDMPPPEGTVRALREAASRVPAVAAVSLAQMTPAGGEPHLTAGVRLAVSARTRTGAARDGGARVGAEPAPTRSGDRGSGRPR